MSKFYAVRGIGRHESHTVYLSDDYEVTMLESYAPLFCFDDVDRRNLNWSPAQLKNRKSVIVEMDYEEFVELTNIKLGVGEYAALTIKEGS